MALARNALLEKLLEEPSRSPCLEQLVEDEILSTCRTRGKEAGDPHAEEIREDTEKAIRRPVRARRDQRHPPGRRRPERPHELHDAASSAQYGIESNQLLQMLAQSGQLEQIFAEVQRSKALDVVLADVTVKNAKGDVLDLGLKAEEADDAEQAEDLEEKPDAKKVAKKAPAEKAATTSPPRTRRPRSPPQRRLRPRRPPPRRRRRRTRPPRTRPPSDPPPLTGPGPAR